MSELSKYLQREGIDQIEDDEDFCQIEYETIIEYCEKRNFKLSDEDMDTIISRGLEESFYIWRDFYYENN